MSRLPPSLLPVRRVAPGARVAIVAPSGPFERETLERAAERLRTRYDVHYGEELFERRGYLAGDDARRTRELQAAISDDRVDAILVARGGYGITRILRAIDPSPIVERRPLLAGYSDVTALHALWARVGVRSLHAAMVARMGATTDERLWDRWIAALEGAPPAPVTGLTKIAGGRASGRLAGGNLALLVALAGTPHAPPLDGAILVLEDIGEKPYRVDRSLTQLHAAGFLERLAGIALGAFTDCVPNADGITIEQVLAERLLALAPGIPLVSGLPVGHIDDNLELPLGAPATLDADAGTLVVHEGVS